MGDGSTGVSNVFSAAIVVHCAGVDVPVGSMSWRRVCAASGQREDAQHGARVATPYPRGLGCIHDPCLFLGGAQGWSPRVYLGGWMVPPIWGSAFGRRLSRPTRRRYAVRGIATLVQEGETPLPGTGAALATVRCCHPHAPHCRHLVNRAVGGHRRRTVGRLHSSANRTTHQAPRPTRGELAPSAVSGT